MHNTKKKSGSLLDSCTSTSQHSWMLLGACTCVPKVIDSGAQGHTFLASSMLLQTGTTAS